MKTPLLVQREHTHTLCHSLSLSSSHTHTHTHTLHIFLKEGPMTFLTDETWAPGHPWEQECEIQSRNPCKQVCHHGLCLFKLISIGV